MQDWNLTDKSAGLENDGQKSSREKLLDGGPNHIICCPVTDYMSCSVYIACEAPKKTSVCGDSISDGEAIIVVS